MKIFRKANGFSSGQNTYDWFISRYCEKVCPYCIAAAETARGKKRPNYKEEELLIHDKIFEYLKTKTNCQICLIGGEPTLHPKGIEYFNEFCKNSLNDPSVHVFLLTHGDIPLSSIEQFNCYGKEEHALLITYHPSQSNFDEWLEKLKLFNNKLNVLVTLIIPNNDEETDHIYKTWEYLMDLGFLINIRLEVDVYHKTYPENLLKYKPLLDRLDKQKQLEIYDQSVVEIENGVETYYKSYDMLKGFDLIPGKTICSNRQFGISSSNVLSAACTQRKRELVITLDTTFSEMDKVVSENTFIKCQATNCVEISNSANQIYIKEK
jgi:pyruvate-formate lyase-activating enzyme